MKCASGISYVEVRSVLVIPNNKCGSYQRLDVSNVSDPDLAGVLGVRQMHLFPRFDKLDCIDPLVTARCSYVVKVVIDTSPGFAIGFVGSRDTDEIPGVVIGPEKSDRIGYLEASCIVLTNLLRCVSVL